MRVRHNDSLGIYSFGMYTPYIAYIIDMNFTRRPRRECERFFRFWFWAQIKLCEAISPASPLIFMLIMVIFFYSFRIIGRQVAVVNVIGWIVCIPFNQDFGHTKSGSSAGEMTNARTTIKRDTKCIDVRRPLKRISLSRVVIFVSNWFIRSIFLHPFLTVKIQNLFFFFVMLGWHIAIRIEVRRYPMYENARDVSRRQGPRPTS